ncbi:hypothetical protein IAE22_34920, partial [Bacillus sp. S34]|nr:hypothetical protein [Bacillus sp. S34]
IIRNRDQLTVAVLDVAKDALHSQGLDVDPEPSPGEPFLFTLGERTDRRWLMLLAALVQFVAPWLSSTASSPSTPPSRPPGWTVQ